MSAAGTKQCATCAQPIPLAAKKCIKCGSYQDWRQYLAFSTTNLALATALISVLSVGVPSVFGFLQPDNSRLRPTYLGFQKTAAVLLVANTGKRPGSVKEARIYLDRGYDGRDIARVVLLEADKNFGIVEPGAVRAVVFESPQLTPDDEKSYDELMANPTIGGSPNCHIIFLLQDFQQNVTDLKEKLNCFSAIEFLAHKRTGWNEI